MSNSVEDALKTSIEDVSEDARLVFSTNITLNERFSNSRSSTLVLTNGFTQPYKNNQLKRRVVFAHQPPVKISSRFERYRSGDWKNRRNEPKNKRKEEVRNVLKRRRVVLMPKKALDDNSTEGCLDIDGNEETSQYKNIKASTPKKARTDTAYRRGNSVERHFYNLDEKAMEHDSRDEVKSSMLGASDCVETSSDQNVSKEPIIFSAFHYIAEKYRKSLYSWDRSHLEKESMYKQGQLITKDDLDTDIDSYMAEAKLIEAVPSTDDDDPFVQEYMMEVDKYSNAN